MEKAELGWKRLTGTWPKPNKGSAHQPFPHVDYLSTDRARGSAEGRDVSGEGKRDRRPTDTIFSARRDVDEQLII